MSRPHSTFYDSYVERNSPAWQAKKRDLATRRPKQCRACGTRHQIDCNHLSYKNLGREPDRDLMWMCRHHHDWAGIVHSMGFSHRTSAWVVVGLVKLRRAIW